MNNKKLIIVSYGGGTNSVAMLIGMHERNIRPDVIIFADTGAEKPHTYHHIFLMNLWCIGSGFPPIMIVKNEKQSRYGGLEQMCLEKKCLPSIAYGFKTCSLVYKKEPFDDWIKQSGITNYERWIGIDAGEERRAKPFVGTRYPLIEWRWDRDDCIAAIERHEIKLPGKSACFFCPSSKKQEIKQLRSDYPELAIRAIALEKNADLTSIKGLGRNYAWSDIYEAEDRQSDLFCSNSIEIDCGCYDGE